VLIRERVCMGGDLNKLLLFKRVARRWRFERLGWIGIGL